VIANCGIIGLKGLRTELGIKPDDGKVEVCIVRSRTLLDLLNLVWNVFIKRKKGRPEMHCLEASQSVHIATSESINFEADGEIVHPTPVELKVVHNAIQVVVPKVIDRPMQEAPVKITEGATPK
jgi:diacylglycerol kinase (ATP)